MAGERPGVPEKPGPRQPPVEVGGAGTRQLKPRERDGRADLKWPGGARWVINRKIPNPKSEIKIMTIHQFEFSIGFGLSTFTSRSVQPFATTATSIAVCSMPR
jgi:hypothetical protein